MNAGLLTIVLLVAATPPKTENVSQGNISQGSVPQHGAYEYAGEYASALPTDGGVVYETSAVGKGWKRIDLQPPTCYDPTFGCYTSNRYMHRYPAFHGTHYRKPYNYRNVFEYPWHAGMHEPTSLWAYNVEEELPPGHHVLDQHQINRQGAGHQSQSKGTSSASVTQRRGPRIVPVRHAPVSRMFSLRNRTMAKAIHQKPTIVEDGLLRVNRLEDLVAFEGRPAPQQLPAEIVTGPGSGYAPRARNVNSQRSNLQVSPESLGYRNSNSRGYVTQTSAKIPVLESGDSRDTSSNLDKRSVPVRHPFPFQRTESVRPTTLRPAASSGNTSVQIKPTSTNTTGELQWRAKRLP